MAVLAASLVGGFAAETASLFDDPWAVVLAVMIPLVLLLVVAVAATLRDKVGLSAALVSGAVAGSLMGPIFLLGVFIPSALELGGRDLNEFGGDVVWYAPLIWGSIVCAAGGAAVGAASGMAAWALHSCLGKKPDDRILDTRG